MYKLFLAIIALIVMCSCTTTSTSSDESIRLDATTAATAEQSFAEMLGQASPEQQQALLVAMLKLNMTGVQSAVEVVGDPELQSPSIVRIKDRVAGMTAEEIIALADSASDVTIEVEYE